MVNKFIKTLKPYVAGEQLGISGLIKLNTNENAYPPSNAVDIVFNGFDKELLRKYPDPESTGLKKAIAEFEGVSEKNIFVGNGSDEVLGFAFKALFNKSVAYNNITYSFYPVYADLFELKKTEIKLKDDFKVDFGEFNKISRKIGGIVFCNPNAPTSISESADDILAVVKNVSCSVICDEAYIDFSTKSKSLASEAVKLQNLLVVKTFSKSYSLAGMRCGYAVGGEMLINALSTVKNCFNSYPIDAVCERITIAALKDRKYFDTITNKIIATRERVIGELKLKGHTVLDSDANFIFVKHKSLGGEVVYKNLKQQNILVRHFAKNVLTAPFVRVTIGTDKDMDKFLEAFA